MNELNININAKGDKAQISAPEIINQYPIIGIDLGVSYWSASIVQDGQIYVIPISGKNHIPAFVACINNEFKFGDEAKQMFFDHREVTIFDLVYILGLRFNSNRELEEHMNDYSYAISNSGDKPKINFPNSKKAEISIEELCDIIINNIIYASEIHLNTTIHNIVVPVPIYFKESQKSALLRATSHVGIIDLIFEPIAAAYAYRIHEKYKEDKIYHFLVYNLQEDNLDVTILEFSNKLFKIKSNIYERHLKKNYTFRFLDELCTQTYETYFISNPRFHPLNSGTLRFYCKTIFQEILDVDCFKIELDTIQDEKIIRCISRAELDELLLTLVQESLVSVDQVLREANLNRNAVNEVLFVGKLTRHNIIRQQLMYFFGRNILNTTLNPADVLAMGAAIRADVLQHEFWNNSGGQKKTYHTQSAETFKQKTIRKRKAKLTLHEKMLSMCALFTNVVSKSNLKMCVKEKLLFVPAYLRNKLKRRSRKLRNCLDNSHVRENIIKRTRKCGLNDLKYLLKSPERHPRRHRRPPFVFDITNSAAIPEIPKHIQPEEKYSDPFLDVINCVKNNLDVYYVTVCFVVFLLHWASENICINIAIALISIAITLVVNNRTVQSMNEI